MIKIGLVGLGHGKTLLQLNTPDVYRSRNDYLKKEIIPMKVTALCDTNEDVLSKFSKEYNIDSCTTDFNELIKMDDIDVVGIYTCLLYTSPSPRDKRQSRMPSSA